MLTIAVTGYSGSGKTTTIEALIPLIKAGGMSVGTIKNIHHPKINMDEPGTDSYRHMAAGADMVTARTPEGTYVLYPRQLSFEELIGLYDVDVLLVEGIYDRAELNLVASKTVEDLSVHCDENTLAVVGCITNTLRAYKGYPVINALEEGMRLADLIVEKVKVGGHCG